MAAVGNKLYALTCFWLLLTAANATRLLAREPFRDVATWIGPAVKLDEPQRIARTFAGCDRLGGLPNGYHMGLYQALMEHVPPAGVIHLDLLRDARQIRAAKSALMLIFPRRVQRHNAPSLDDVPPPRDYMLSFNGERSARLEHVRTRLASGPGWALWH